MVLLGIRGTEGVLCEIVLRTGRGQVNSGRSTDGINRLPIPKFKLVYGKQVERDEQWRFRCMYKMQRGHVDEQRGYRAIPYLASLGCKLG